MIEKDKKPKNDKKMTFLAPFFFKAPFLIKNVVLAF